MDIDDYKEHNLGSLGQRSSMQDGSGNTHWKYNLLGQAVEETKVISATGGLTGTFTTQWSYNLAGLVETMRYPGDNQGGLGEVITYTYHNQKALNAVFGTDTYVRGTSYDAAGRACPE